MERVEDELSSRCAGRPRLASDRVPAGPGSRAGRHVGDVRRPADLVVGEGDHVADVGRAQDEHDQAVEAQGDARGGGMSGSAASSLSSRG